MIYRLDAFVLAMSQHYRLLREVVAGAKKGVPAYPSVRDARTADMLTMMIGEIAGAGLTNMCKLAFRRAYMHGDPDLYNVREILETLRDHAKNEFIRERLATRMDALVDMVERLSNPVAERKVVHRKKTSPHEEQLLLFPDPEPAAPEPEKKEKPKAEPKPRARPKKKAEPKPRKQKKSKFDKLADEIIEAEYGREDDYAEEGECDAFEYCSGGGGMRNDDYNYFSGNCDDY